MRSVCLVAGLFVIFYLSGLCVGEDLMSCGGFIRSIVPIPFSRIQVMHISYLVELKYTRYNADAISNIVRLA